ncbi:MAG TPA: cache domain-containing protein [Phycisphaerae bacterium]|nr:cache domain-containing protein [Phycisphaerae bacterium]HNU44298.1 cache domain-containing protein [Phycisphaerae bacterium]
MDIGEQAQLERGVNARPPNPRRTPRLWLRLALAVGLPSLSGVMLLWLAAFALILPTFERSLLGGKQEMIRNLTETACAAVARYHQRVLTGELTLAEGQTRAIATVHSLRYGRDSKDYFWISDMDCRMVVHPFRADLQGHDLSDVADPEGRRPFAEITRLARQQGRGYVTYLWQEKDQPERISRKLAYVQRFEPWEWIIGTGVYLNDVEAEIGALTRRLGIASAVVLGVVTLLSAFVIWQGARTEARRHRAELKNHVLQEQLYQAQKLEAIGQLAGGVAHEFNNLLPIVLGGVEQIRGATGRNPEVQSALIGIEQAVAQGVAVTRSLLTFGHRLPVNLQPLRLATVVENAARLLRRMLPAAIELRLETAGEPSLWVNADGNQLQQVLLNLAINARDAMPMGGVLRLSVSSERRPAAAPGPPEQATQWARLEVADAGVGMSATVQARLFEPFFTTKKPGQGTGLGLPVVQGIIKNHGGEIHVHSQVGGGSTFVITLPCIAPPLPTVPALEGPASLCPADPNGDREGPDVCQRDPASGAPSPGARRSAAGADPGVVLLAARNRDMREIMASGLKSLGHPVIQAGDDESVRWLCGRSRSSLKLLILDTDVPACPATECLSALRRQGINAPTLLITDDAPLGRDDTLGPDAALLRRPFRMTELVDVAARLLHRSTVREVLT